MNTPKINLKKWALFLTLLAGLPMLLYSFKSKKVLEDYYYFQFTPQPASIPGDGDYTNASNWTQLPSYNPEESESPCPTGSEFVCVLQVLQDDVDNADGMGITDRLTDYIDDQPSPATYVNASGNALTKKNRASR